MKVLNLLLPMMVIGIYSCMQPSQSIDDYLKINECNYKLASDVTNDISIAQSPRFSNAIRLSEQHDSSEIMEIAKCQIKKIINTKGLSAVTINIRHHDASYRFDNPVFNISFAPNGKWEEADKDAPLEDYSIIIEHWDWHGDYFQQ